MTRSSATEATGPPPNLRVATVSDAGIIAEIYNESIAAGDATMDEGAKSVADIVGWIEGFSPRELILLLEEAVDLDESPESRRRVLGWGIIKRYSDRAGYRFACETAVYLRRGLTGRGLGTCLKKALIERCRQLGYRHLVAKIFARNEASIRYNLKLGYELVGIQRGIGWKNGRFIDIAILQLLIDDTVLPENG